MKFAFQMNNGIETVLLAGYENEVTNREAREKENKARLHKDTEMRVTELTVRGLKRKAFRKETAGEKASRGQKAKKAMIDGLWQAGARKEKEKEKEKEREKEEGVAEKRRVKTRPGPKRRNPSPNTVQLAKNKGSVTASSRLAKMWADQLNHKPDPVCEHQTRGQKRKMLNPVGSQVKAGRMEIQNEDQTAEIEYELNIVQLNKEQLFNKDINFKSPVIQPAEQSVAKEDSFRVWCGKPEQVREAIIIQNR